MTGNCSKGNRPPDAQDTASGRRLRRGLAAAGWAGAAMAAVLIIYLAWLIPATPSIADLRKARVIEPSVLLAADGTHLATFRRTQQEWVDLAQVSPYVIKALIATEDHRFYRHGGIDLRRALAAALHTLAGDAQGGSTITQQLARNLYPEEIGRARTPGRKLREIVTALKIERAYTKEQILETYLNTVPFLYNTVGIEMAARTYYDKSARDLGLLESATLVGMLKGTHYYNPVTSPERARQRRNVVLAQMVKHGMLSEEEYRSLRRRPLQARLYRLPEALGPAPHFAEHARKWLMDWAERNDYDIYADGLVVHTTLDPRLQEAAVRAVRRQADALQAIADVEWGQASPLLLSTSPASYVQMRGRIEPFRHFWKRRPGLLDAFVRESPEFRKAVEAGAAEAAALARLKADRAFMKRLKADKTRLQAGFVALDPASGEVKAWVGSRDFLTDQFDHVAQAERQPGSTFKPLVYGAALEQGLPPDQLYHDTPVEIPLSDGKVWRPGDMSGASGLPMTLREGLIHSKNSITAQVMRDVGLSAIIALARAAGVSQSRLDPVPSLALGTSPVTLLEMVSAYGTIAALGEYHRPVFIRRITDRHGRVLAEFSTEARRALSEATAVELIDMMRGVVSQGTGHAVRTRFGIGADIAGKTGTTQNNTDGWFILMHPQLVAGAWVGFNDPRVTMRSDYWGQGGHNAILVVGDFFRGVLKAKLVDIEAEFPRPRRQPIMITVEPADPDWADQLQRDGEVITPHPVPPGTLIITPGRPDGDEDEESAAEAQAN